MEVSTDAERRCFTSFSLALAAFAVGALALACSVGGKGAQSEAVPSSSPEPAVREHAITTREFAYDAPATVEAGMVRFRMENAGAEPHQAALFRINDDVTDAEFEAALQEPDPATILRLVTAKGGPNTIDPGETQDVTSALEPGRYAWLCFVPSPDGVPHLAKGMVTRFDVTASGDAGGPPSIPAGTTVTLDDFGFTGAESLTSGPQVVRVDNAGQQIHELTVVRLPDGMSVGQLSAALERGGPPAPRGHAGGVAGLASGETAWVDFNLAAGTYALLCLVPDPATGRPHYALGMIQELRVD